MSSLNDKANALRELAARLDRIDTEIQQLLSDAPSVVVAVEIPPIKHFDFITPRSWPTPVAPWKNVVIEPKVPALAFGQVIYKRSNDAPRFIIHGKGSDKVVLLDSRGKRANGYCDLAALANAVGEGRTYVLQNPATEPTTGLQFGQVIHFLLDGPGVHPRFVTRGEAPGSVRLLDEYGDVCYVRQSLEALEEDIQPRGRMYSLTQSA